MKPSRRIRSYRSIRSRLWPRAGQVYSSHYDLLGKIRSRCSVLELFDSETFLEKAARLRDDVRGGLDVLSAQAVVESFALTAEALRRATGKIYYDVQLLAGIVLATGNIAEMQTGEGKTITCALPAVLYAWTGRGVHVATTNAYLAERDREELTEVFAALGVSSGLIKSDQDPRLKRDAYVSDITYGTGYEFGFDFLRDQLALRRKPELPLGTRFLSRLRGMPTSEVQLTQRELAFAIIDEADSVLIDEATTPLILSGNSRNKPPVVEVYSHAMHVADSMKPEHYEFDPVKRNIELTDAGWKYAHSHLPAGIQNHLMRPWSQYVEQSLHAARHFVRDRDYVVSDKKVMIVDRHTGRIHEERKWRSGLHQSVEMREDVPLTPERDIEARITRQRYFGFYESVCGMTGTATGNETELMEFYGLPVVEIPRNKPSKRVNEPARYFKDAESKYAAIAGETAQRSNAGQPVLVGTRTISQTREISACLNAAGVPHTVLNGTQDESEAALVSAAGESGAVLIATNMAGRGTDIKLDNRARAAGGLHVIASEHHDSKRVDRQLIGRAARQSDPGSCRFFVAADDDIIQRFDPALGEAMIEEAGDNGETTRSFDRELEKLQETVERIQFVARKKMVVHDNWIETVQKTVARLA